MSSTPIAPIYPWKRFLARSIDSVCYLAIACMLYLPIGNFLGSKVNAVSSTDTTSLLLIWLIGWLIQISTLLLVALFGESALLSIFATTFGKRLLKIRVVNADDGQIPSRSQCVRRTVCMMWRTGIPFALVFPLLGPIIVCGLYIVQLRKYSKQRFLSWDKDQHTLLSVDSMRPADYIPILILLLVVCALSGYLLFGSIA